MSIVGTYIFSSPGCQNRVSAHFNGSLNKYPLCVHILSVMQGARIRVSAHFNGSLNKCPLCEHILSVTGGAQIQVSAHLLWFFEQMSIVCTYIIGKGRCAEPSECSHLMVLNSGM
jgi:hypothetical protein